MGNPLYLAEVGPGCSALVCTGPFCPHSAQLEDSKDLFFRGGVFKSSYTLSRGIRLANSRKIRKAPGVEWSGWDFTVSLPCLTATS